MIDGGPSRVPHAGQRRALPRQEPVRRQPEPQTIQDPAPAPVVRSVEVREMPSRDAQKSPKGAIIAISIAALLVILGLIAWMLFGSTDRVAGEIDSSKHQVVFLPNGQLYFGKLEVLDGEYFKLKDVWYIQNVTEEGSEAATDDAATEPKLIKRGAEVYGPEDTMVLSRDQVMSFENIKSDSEVARLISNYKP